MIKTNIEDWVLLYEPWATTLIPHLNGRSVIKIQKISDIPDKILKAATTLFVIGPREWADLYELLNIRQVYDIVIGILPMENKQKAVDKIAMYKDFNIIGEDIVIDRINTGSTYSLDQLKIYPEGSINHFDELLDQLNRSFRYFSIVSHGRGDVVYFPFAVLCGKKEGISGIEDKNLPHCFYHNECFYKGRPIIKMQDIKSNIIFLNSCSSLNGTNGLFNEAYGLDSEVFEKENIYALIGSPMNRYGDSDQSILFSILLDSGYSIGEIVQLIDDTVTMRNIENRTLLIYGDPTLRLVESFNNNVFHIEENSSLIKLNSPVRAIYYKQNPVQNEILFIEGITNVKILPTRKGYFILPNQGVIEPGNYHVNRVALVDYIKDIKDRINNPIRILDNIKLLGINPASVSGKIRELQMNSLSIERILIDLTQSFSMKSFEKLQKKIMNISHDILLVQKTIVLELVKKTHKTNFHFFESYKRECIRKTLVSETLCHYCGKGTVKNKWVHPFQYNFEREVLQCLRCGYLNDRAVGYENEASIKINRPLRLGQTEEIEVHFSQSHAKNTVVALCMVDINKYGEQSPVFDIKLLEEDKGDIKFTLTIPAALPAHHYWLRLYVFNDKGIHSYGTNIFLEPLKSPQD
ncbi:hypothetical protein [Bacillus sp. E(2018)]|uniref:hypothetical protein n=1 Tax=Bacillus sp. E(2018) TaxID=2502239 RepID=UPI0010F982D9|nr:hypothetical protein [Bacillus sp. E(2018)]